MSLTYYVLKENDELVAFTRPSGFGDVQPIDLPGYTSKRQGDVVKLEAIDVFCGRV